MPTSGLVLSTESDADLPAVLAALDARDSVTCGEPISQRLPIVAETSSKAEDKALWEWLWALPGVASVDVAFIYLDDHYPGDHGAPTPVGVSKDGLTHLPLGSDIETAKGNLP